MNWFEEWFDSPYYHLLYANRSDAEAELFINKLAAFLEINANSKVLDVACGKGRHSKTLAKLGFDVTGIDLSKRSIAYAQQFSHSRLNFEVWDMRKVFNPGEYDVVFNLFSSFGYFDNAQDDYKCVQAFLDELKPGGRLVLDYINSEWAVKNMKAKEIVPRGEVQFHIQKRLEGGFLKKRIEFLANGENYLFEEQLKMINRSKFELMLTAAGFDVKYVFGNYDLSPFENAASPRLIIIAQKA